MSLSRLDPLVDKLICTGQIFCCEYPSTPLHQSTKSLALLSLRCLGRLGQCQRTDLFKFQRRILRYRYHGHRGLNRSWNECRHLHDLGFDPCKDNTRRLTRVVDKKLELHNVQFTRRLSRPPKPGIEIAAVELENIV